MSVGLPVLLAIHQLSLDKELSDVTCTTKMKTKASTRALITDEELREFTSEYYIPFALHPVVPACEMRVIAGFPRGWDKISHTAKTGLLQCYTEKLDALRRWREMFFWVDDAMFPWDFAFYTQESLPRDERPPPGSYRGVPVKDVRETHLIGNDNCARTGGTMEIIERLESRCWAKLGIWCLKCKRGAPVINGASEMACQRAYGKFELDMTLANSSVSPRADKAGAGGSADEARSAQCAIVEQHSSRSYATEAMPRKKWWHCLLFNMCKRVEGLLEKQEEKLRKLSIEYDEELYPHMLKNKSAVLWEMFVKVCIGTLDVNQDYPIARTIPHSDGVYQFSVATEAPKDIEHLGKLEEAGDARTKLEFRGEVRLSQEGTQRVDNPTMWNGQGEGDGVSSTVGLAREFGLCTWQSLHFLYHVALAVAVHWRASSTQTVKDPCSSLTVDSPSPRWIVLQDFDQSPALRVNEACDGGLLKGLRYDSVYCCQPTSLGNMPNM
ncbi:hypothetical protein Tco_0373861 [Tanacetum coccineum]